jgi:hypothetical protein
LDRLLQSVRVGSAQCIHGLRKRMRYQILERLHVKCVFTRPVKSDLVRRVRDEIVSPKISFRFEDATQLPKSSIKTAMRVMLITLAPKDRRDYVPRYTALTIDQKECEQPFCAPR